MKQILSVVFILSVFTHATANEQQPDRVKITADLRVRVRYEEKPGSDSVTYLQDRAALKGYVNLSKDGCLKARFNAVTGTKFSSFWGDTGIGEKPKDQRQNEFAVRHLYLDKQFCEVGNLHLMMGSMPPIKQGSLGFKPSGAWIDGSRVTYEAQDGTYEVSMTLGRVAEYDTPEAFARDWHAGQFVGGADDGRFAEVTLAAEVGENLSFFTSVAEHTNNLYFRNMIRYDLEDMSLWFDSAEIEALMVEGELYSSLFVVRKRINEKWKTSFGYIRTDAEFPGETGTQIIPIEGFYGLNTDDDDDQWVDNVFVMAERKLGNHCAAFGEFRHGDTGPLYRGGAKCSSDILGNMINRWLR